MFFFQVIISTLLVLPFDIASLIGIFSFTAWIFYGLTASTVLIFRYRNKNKITDSYKVISRVKLWMTIITSNCYIAL